MTKQRKPREYRGWIVAGPHTARFTGMTWPWYGWKDGQGYMYSETLAEMYLMIRLAERSAK